MRLVVAKGTGGNAAALGYVVGGKTGTADKPGRGGYRGGGLIASFVAAFPMQAPRYVVLVVVDEPRGNKTTGGWVAAPVVRRVIERAAPLLGVLPVDEEAPAIQQALDIQIKTEERRLASF
jgi:cell division protein FtsI (penicillin-binding protein 3)